MSVVVRQHSFNPVSGFVILASGIFLISLAVPALHSLYTTHSAKQLAGELNDTAFDPAPDQLEAAALRYTGARKLELGRRQYARDQVAVLLRLYYKMKTAKRSLDASNALDQASHALTISLRQAPGDANLWYLLAEIRALQNKMDDQTRRYLGMSYLSGPREGWIALRRLRFSLRYWLLLDKDLRDFARREIRTLWSNRTYRRILMSGFSSSPRRSRRIIFAEIKKRGEADVENFKKLAKSAGWKTF